MSGRAFLLLILAHFFIDNYSSMLGAYLPFLRENLGLSLSQAGLLGGVLVFSSSFMQPLYGYLADRYRSRFLVALAPACTGSFISLLGVAPNFWVLLLLVFLGGVGIAAFHPQGAAVISSLAPHRRGAQMSFFITGGLLGYSLGPIYITFVILLVGLEKSYWAAFPGLLMSLLLVWQVQFPPVAPAQRREQGVRRRLWEHRRSLTLHYLIVVTRSAIQLVFVAFLPLYLTEGGLDKLQASQYLTLFLAAGGLSCFLGGFLADRWGGKWISAISSLGTLPALLGFLYTEGPWSLLWCALGGAFLLLASPVNVAMAQRLVPEGASTVSALTMGFAWGMGGLAVPLAGLLSDLVGLRTTLGLLPLLALPGFLLSLALPAEKEQVSATALTAR